MKSSIILVVEPDNSRAESLAAALTFMGYEPRRVGHDDVEGVAAMAVFVGSIGGNDALSVAMGPLGAKASKLPLLVAADAPMSAELVAINGHRGAELVDFPLRYARLAAALRTFEALADEANANRRFVGASAPMQRINNLIRQVAPFDSSVLVLGESGTGKELVARTIHDCSPRADKPFIAINCGAIPAELLESELFGHEKGAFTGAINTRKGRFELAEGGTLFLDEIGDMSLPMQVKLLRVLQERTFERVGGNKPQRCDVRIIAATHRNLEQSIQNGVFREDLFYRLNVFPVEMPPLRERMDDLSSLIGEFNHRLAQRGLGNVRFSGQALAALRGYAWPGNVRELSNLVERMAILLPHGEIRAADLPEKYRGASVVGDICGAALLAYMEEQPVIADTYANGNDAATLPAGGLDLKDHLAGIEIGLIRQALDSANGVVAHAAKLLRVQRTTLVEKLRKYGLNDAVQITA